MYPRTVNMFVQYATFVLYFPFVVVLNTINNYCHSVYYNFHIQFKTSLKTFLVFIKRK